MFAFHAVCGEHCHPELEALVGLLKCFVFFAVVLFIICFQQRRGKRRVQKEKYVGEGNRNWRKKVIRKTMKLDGEQVRRGGERAAALRGSSQPAALGSAAPHSACSLSSPSPHRPTSFTDKCWQRQSKGGSAWAWSLARFIHNITNHVTPDDFVSCWTAPQLLHWPPCSWTPRHHEEGCPAGKVPQGLLAHRSTDPLAQMTQASRDRLPASHSSPGSQVCFTF